MVVNNLECNECGNTIPEELLENLIQGEPIYCEGCGVQIKLDIDSLQLIKSQQLIKKDPKSLRDILITARKKSVSYTKKKLRESLYNIKKKN